MDSFASAIIGTAVLDLVIVEIYFFLALRIKNPQNSAMIVAVWILFMTMYFGLVIATQIPLSVLAESSTDTQRLLAQVPVIIATIYIFIFKRKELKEMRERFSR